MQSDTLHALLLYYCLFQEVSASQQPRTVLQHDVQGMRSCKVQTPISELIQAGYISLQFFITIPPDDALKYSSSPHLNLTVVIIAIANRIFNAETAHPTALSPLPTLPCSLPFFQT